jgi:Uma2 family endonuclease
MATIPTESEVFYPESDGKPMAETTFHRDVMIETIVGLKDWFADDPLAYVSGNEFLYWVEGDPRRNVSPDVWVARGIDKSIPRRSYKTWLDGGKGPDFVLEASSRSTRREDLGKKFRLYRDDLAVREYFLFDPLGEYLKPPLQGFRLAEGEYRPVEPVGGRLPSEVLALHLEADGVRLRLYDPATARHLLTRLEALEAERQEHRRKDAELLREREELRRKNTELQQAEDEIARLRRELEDLRAGKKPKRK